MIQALLFDLDGTLADTAIVNASAYAAALAEHGVHIDSAELLAITRGRNWRQFLPELLGNVTYTQAEHIAERKKMYYADMIKDVAINSALLAILTAYRPLGKTGLVTTASGANAHAILDYHQLNALFDVIVTGDDVSRHKPDPEAYLLATQQLQVIPAQCIAFEDSEIGIASAESAGIASIQIVFPPKR